jgi:hypothetical protein
MHADKAGDIQVFQEASDLYELPSGIPTEGQFCSPDNLLFFSVLLEMMTAIFWNY